MYQKLQFVLFRAINTDNPTETTHFVNLFAKKKMYVYEEDLLIVVNSLKFLIVQSPQ